MTTIRHHVTDDIAYVSVDNPRRLNIVGQAANEELARIFEDLATADGIRAAVLKGAGDRAFIGGADIREMVALNPETADAFIASLRKVCRAIRQAPMPVVAEIRGYCLGAGLEIAACCDLRVAARDAVFAMPEVKVGIPSVIEAALLPRLIGWGRTARLLYTGEAIDAEQALAWGLVEQLVDGDALEAATAALVHAIAAAGPRAVRAQKALLRQWEALPLEQAIECGVAAFREAYTSDEPRVAMQRFLDRRRPK